jgi:hypothetical protein
MAHKTSLFFQKKKVFVAAAALAGMTSWMACTKFDLGVPEIQANPEFAAAIGKFSFLFSDFIKGDSLIKVGVDSSIALKYAKDSIAGYSVADVVNRATGGVGNSLAPKTIRLGVIPIADLAPMNQTTTLSQFAGAFAPPLSTLFTSGGTTPPAPIPADSVNANVRNNLANLNDFQYVTLSTGSISMRVTNNFPFAINNLKIDLLDRSAGDTLITTIIVGNIAVGGTETGTGVLDGKTFSNQLAYRINRLSYGAIPPNTVIAPTATLAVQVSTTNFKVKRGNAVIPARSLAGDTILASMATNNADQRLTELTIKSATMNINSTKTTPIDMTLVLTFPQMFNNGSATPVSITVTPGQPTPALALNNAVLKLDQIAAQPYNQLPISVSVSVIGSNGALRLIDENHTVTVTASFGNLQIGGAKGQFGNFDIPIPATNQDFGADFGFLSNESKRLFFASPSLKIKMLNSFGLTINTELAMEATGFLPGTEKLLRKPNGGNIGFTIPRLPIAQMGQLASGTYSVDTLTTTIQNFMSILPKKIAASGMVSMRSTGLVPGLAANWDYFTSDSRIKLGLEMDIPMKFSAENLTVRDTVTTFAGVLKPDQVQYVDYVAMDIQYKTRLPLGVTVDLATLVNGVTTRVVTDIVLPAADAIDANGKVTAQKADRFEVKISAAQLSQLSDAPKVVFIAKIKTANGGFKPVAMFTHYDFDMGIGMRVKTKIVK